MGAIASQITSLTIVYSTLYADADQRKHQSSASLAFVRGIHRGSVNSPYKWPVTRKMFPFDEVIMNSKECQNKHETHLTCTICVLLMVFFFLCHVFATSLFSRGNWYLCEYIWTMCTKYCVQYSNELSLCGVFHA